MVPVSFCRIRICISIQGMPIQTVFISTKSKIKLGLFPENFNKLSEISKSLKPMTSTRKTKTMYTAVYKSLKAFRFSNMCKNWGRLRIWFWISNKMEIQIRIGIMVMSIFNTGTWTTLDLSKWTVSTTSFTAFLNSEKRNYYKCGSAMVPFDFRYCRLSVNIKKIK